MLLFALAGMAFSAWIGMNWPPSWIAAALFAVSAAVLAAAVLRPRIEIFETHLAVGSRAIRWNEIRRVDRTSWNAPLILQLTLSDAEKVTIVYPGVVDAGRSLLADVQRRSRQAHIDGIPYREFWTETAAVAPPPATKSARNAAHPPVRYPMLRPEDEREIELMFQKLKSARRLEQPESGEPIESAGADD